MKTDEGVIAEVEKSKGEADASHVGNWLWAAARTKLANAAPDLAARLQKANERVKWRPISEAPKDGSSLLLAWPFWSGRPIIGHWSDKIGGWDADCQLYAGDPPTHFQYLPELPEPPTP